MPDPRDHHDAVTAESVTVAGNAVLKAISVNVPPGGVPANKLWIIFSVDATITGDFQQANKFLPFNDGSGKSYTTSESPQMDKYYLNS